MLDRRPGPAVDWRAALYPDEAERIGEIDRELETLAKRKKALLADLAPIRNRAHKRGRRMEDQAS